MLLPAYFQQDQNSGTTNTRLLEGDRLLNSLASLVNNIETPASLIPEGGFVLTQQQRTSHFTTFLDISEGVGTITPITSAQINSTPISIYQPLVAQQEETASLNPQEAYKLVKSSFESYKTERKKYSSLRAREITSFIDDNNNE